MKEGIAMIDAHNCTEELMEVNAGKADKGAVFEANKKKYADHFAQNEVFEKQKQELTAVIVQNAPGLTACINSVGNDPAKNEYFQKINEAICVQEQLSVLLEQGNQFYMKLNDILIKLQQSINDYKFSRDLQKNELISGGGAAGNSPNPPPGGAQGGMPGQPQGQMPGQMPGQQPQMYGGYGMPMQQ